MKYIALSFLTLNHFCFIFAYVLFLLFALVFVICRFFVFWWWFFIYSFEFIQAERSSKLFWLKFVCWLSCCLCRTLFIFFGSISTKLGTEYHWVKEIHVCSNEGPCPFQRGDNLELLKKNWHFSKFFSETDWPEKLKFRWKHP